MTYASNVYLFHENKLPLRDNEFGKPTFHVPFTHSTETFLHRKRVPFAHFTILVVWAALAAAGTGRAWGEVAAECSVSAISVAAEGAVAGKGT